MTQKKSLEVKVLGMIMLFYGLWSLCVPFMGQYYKLPVLRSSGLFLLFLTPGIFIEKWLMFLFIIEGFIGILYLISGIFILKFKNWARSLAVYFSALMILVMVCIFIYAVIDALTLKGPVITIVPLGIGLLILMIPFWPFLLFLYFFTRPRIKEQFKQ